MSELGTDDPPVDLILDVIDAEMPDPKQPKGILFDIGGVCVSCQYSLAPFGTFRTGIGKYSCI